MEHSFISLRRGSVWVHGGALKMARNPLSLSLERCSFADCGSDERVWSIRQVRLYHRKVVLSFCISTEFLAGSVRARSHCGKQNAKRCVFMTVARQICILEYGVSLSCKRGLKRTQTKTGVSEGGGGEKIHANVNAAKREFRTWRTLFFEKTKKNNYYCQLSQRFSSRHWLLSAKGEFVRKLLEVKIMKTWVGRLFTQPEPKIGNAPSELVFRVEAKIFETWPKRNHVNKRARFSKTQ